MYDKAFLQWIHDHLENVCGEDHNMDFMYKLRAVIKATNPKQYTPNVGE